MTDLSSLLLAAALSIGTHSFGHIAEGNKQNVPMYIDPASLQEIWERPEEKKKRMLIYGAGFRGQDALSKFTEEKTIANDIRLANGLYKLGYLAEVPQKLGANIVGDVPLMNKEQGDNVAGISILTSALVDLYKAKNPDNSWDIEFWQALEGTPGLKATIKY